MTEEGGQESNRRLIVGLGNPGRKYDGTRHNVGFATVALLAKRFDVGRPKARFDGEVVEVNASGNKVILLCPLTYMNASGKSVKQACDFYKIGRSEVLVVCDDFNLSLGRLRVRPSGSAGGQKGLQDILNKLGAQDVPRLRIGIGTPPPRWAIPDYVLSRFGKDELPEIEEAIEDAADAAVHWADQGIEACMNRFNAAK